MNLLKVIRTAAFLLFILLLAVSFVYFQNFSWENLWGDLYSEPVFAAFILIGFYMVKIALFFIPIQMLFAGAGFLFKLPMAFAISYLGLCIEHAIGFLLGRYVGKDFIINSMEKYRASNWLLESARKNSSFAAFVIRLLPGPPTELTNMFFGSLDMRFPKYLVCSLLGTTPGMILSILMGKAIIKPASKDFLIPLFINLALPAVATVFYYLVKQNQKHRS
jgi:uncharacterized membrane protein YdjX (TVP38/TMEM64 family)